MNNYLKTYLVLTIFILFRINPAVAMENSSTQVNLQIGSRANFQDHDFWLTLGENVPPLSIEKKSWEETIHPIKTTPNHNNDKVISLFLLDSSKNKVVATIKLTITIGLTSENISNIIVRKSITIPSDSLYNLHLHRSNKNVIQTSQNTISLCLGIDVNGDILISHI